MSYKITKQNGKVSFVNEQFLDSVVEESDIVEEFVAPTERPIPTAEDIAEMSRVMINNDSRQYLAETDWYITRLSETAVPIPVDVLTKRQEAREAITGE